MSQENSKFRLIDLPEHIDDRGSLCVFEYEKFVPFKPERQFWVWGVPKGVRRGGHAHKDSTQVHFCMGGTATVTLDDGTSKNTFVLDNPTKGLLVEPTVWGEFELSSKDAFFVVISSLKYDPEDYIRDYDEFLEYIKKQKIQKKK